MSRSALRSVLAVIAALTVAFVAVSPVGAAFTPTKKAVKKIAKRMAKKMATRRVNALAPGIADSRVNALAPGIAAGVANDLAGRVAVDVEDAIHDLPDGESTLHSVALTSSAPGFLVVTGGVDLFSNGGTGFPGGYIAVDGARVAGSLRVSEISGNNTEEDLSLQVALPVAAGPHTVTLEITDVPALVSAGESSLVAMWLPFGATGAPPMAGARPAAAHDDVMRSPARNP